MPKITLCAIYIYEIVFSKIPRRKPTILCMKEKYQFQIIYYQQYKIYKTSDKLNNVYKNI
jgi:hypothetical protein